MLTQISLNVCTSEHMSVHVVTQNNSFPTLCFSGSEGQHHHYNSKADMTSAELHVEGYDDNFI